MEEATRRLARFCRERVGDRLQALVVYRADGFDAVYLRDDIQEIYTPQEFANLIDSARQVHEVLVPLAETETPIGTHTATVHAFEHSIVLQLPIDEEVGCTISMNPDVGSNVVTFVRDCRAELES